MMKTAYYSISAPTPADLDALRRLGAVLFGQLMEAQAGCCYLCGEPFSEDLPPTRDHVHPRAEGGKDKFNQLLACSPCNNTKGKRLPTAAEARLLFDVYDHIRFGRTGPLLNPRFHARLIERITHHDPLKPRRLALIERMRSL